MQIVFDQGETLGMYVGVVRVGCRMSVSTLIDVFMPKVDPTFILS